MTLLCCGQFYLCAQGSEFNKRILLDQRSTIFRNILVDGDSLIISGEIGEDSLGLSGIFVLKIDSFGNIGKMHYFRDPSLNDHLLLDGKKPFIRNNSGNLIVTGVFLVRDDLYFMDLDENLDSIIYREYLSNYVTMYAEDVFEYEDSYYVTGHIQSSHGDHDVFFQKIDKKGNKIWEKTYGVPSRDEVCRAAIVENGGLTLLISEAFDNTPTIKNDTRYWIRFMHIDTSGTILSDWKEEVTGHEGWSGSLVKYGTDYIYTANFLGEEYGFGFFQAGQVVRRDKDFHLIWRRQYGAPDTYFNGLGDLIIAPDSNLLITGQILDESKKNVLQRVMKICPDGEILWEVRDTGIILNDGESLNYMEGIVASSCNSTYAVGYSYKSSGFYEGLILKVSGDGCIDTLCTTVDIEEILKNKINNAKVYPNPASDHITFDTKDASEERNVELFNLQGNLMIRQNLSPGSNTIQIDKSVFPEGLYIWRLTDKTGKLINVGKIVVLR